MTTITNLCFADDIDGLAGKEDKLASLMDRLDKTSAVFSMEISAEKTTLMTNNANRISIDIRINSEKLDAVVTDQGSKPEVLSRIAQTKAALARLNTILNHKHIFVSSKIRLMRFLVISVLLYACITWILTADIPKKSQTTEMRCFRKLLGISYRDHITNDAVSGRIRQAIGSMMNSARRKKKGPTKESLGG